MRGKAQGKNNTRKRPRRSDAYLKNNTSSKRPRPLPSTAQDIPTILNQELLEMRSSVSTYSDTTPLSRSSAATLVNQHTVEISPHRSPDISLNGHVTGIHLPPRPVNMFTTPTLSTTGALRVMAHEAEKENHTWWPFASRTELISFLDQARPELKSSSPLNHSFLAAYKNDAQMHAFRLRGDETGARAFLPRAYGLWVQTQCQEHDSLNEYTYDSSFSRVSHRSHFSEPRFVAFERAMSSASTLQSAPEFREDYVTSHSRILRQLERPGIKCLRCHLLKLECDQNRPCSECTPDISKLRIPCVSTTPRYVELFSRSSIMTVLPNFRCGNFFEHHISQVFKILLPSETETLDFISQRFGSRKLALAILNILVLRIKTDSWVHQFALRFVVTYCVATRHTEDDLILLSSESGLCDLGPAPSYKAKSDTSSSVSMSSRLKMALNLSWHRLQERLLDKLSELASRAYANNNLYDWPAMFIISTCLLIVWEDLLFAIPSQSEPVSSLHSSIRLITTSPLYKNPKIARRKPATKSNEISASSRCRNKRLNPSTVRSYTTRSRLVHRFIPPSAQVQKVV
jgi:hypothetical protein